MCTYIVSVSGVFFVGFFFFYFFFVVAVSSFVFCVMLPHVHAVGTHLFLVRQTFLDDFHFCSVLEEWPESGQIPC